MGAAHGNVGVRTRIAAEIVAIFATPVVLVACAIANFNQTALLTLVVVLASIGIFFASYEASRPRLRDIMPTLLELAGAPIPETVDGTSLLHPVEREYLHGEHTLGEDSMHFILTKEDKYIWYSQTGRELYFYLRDDPHETKNVLDENPERVAELRALLIDALKNREEQYTDGHTLFVGKTPLTVLQNTEVL